MPFSIRPFHRFPVHCATQHKINEYLMVRNRERASWFRVTPKLGMCGRKSPRTGYGVRTIKPEPPNTNAQHQHHHTQGVS